MFEDFARRFAALDLTPAQFSTLVAISDNPGRRQSDIAAALGVQRPNFVAMMDESGAARPRRARALGRGPARQRAGADPAGVALLDRALAAQAEQEAAIRDALGETERRKLIATLEKLRGC